jgi:lipid-A-disaccharide synthase
VNLGLARRAKELGIPVVFFVGPQVWAWKKHRLPQIRRNVDRMLVIFPFEEPWYRERGVAATFVGHPLAELPAPAVSREAFALENGLDAAKEWIGLRPGEIALNLPAMLGAAAFLGSEYEFLLPLAPTLTERQIASVRAAVAKTPEFPATLVTDARAALSHARASVVASGTATVEAALIGNPFIVVYRLSRLSYAVAKRFVKVPHVAMANLIAGQRVVPELIQDEFTAAKVVAALRPLLEETPERRAMVQALAGIRDALHGQSSAIETVAGHVLSLLPASKQPTSTPLSVAL